MVVTAEVMRDERYKVQINASLGKGGGVSGNGRYHGRRKCLHRSSEVFSEIVWRVAANSEEEQSYKKHVQGGRYFKTVCDRYLCMGTIKKILF